MSKSKLRSKKSKLQLKTQKFLILSFGFAFLLLTFNFPSRAQEPTGGIEGDIRLEGARPEKSAPAVVEYHGPCGTKRSTSVVRMWKNRVMYGTSWLTPKGEGRPSFSSADEEEPAYIGGIKCEFHPQMTILKAGSIVLVVNEDPTVQWLIVEEKGEKKQQVMQEPQGLEPLELKLEEGGDIHLMSGFYPWMEAWIKPVSDVVSVSSTDWDGRFYFKDIPAGEYILHSWHAALGETSQDVVVERGKTVKVEVRYQMPEESPLPVIESPMLEEIFGDFDNIDDEPF